jgi:hypothetical protein
MIRFFSKKIDVGRRVMKEEKFLPYMLIVDVTYSMWPQFFSTFKVEKDGLPKYKAHWNFIQFNTRMSMERTFGMLKGKFKILPKIVNIPLCHMPDLVLACICLHNMCIASSDGFDMD